MYAVDEVDLAGNRYTIHTGTFEHCCAMYCVAKQHRPSHEHLICNPDRVDVGLQDGLTEEEREMLP